MGAVPKTIQPVKLFMGVILAQERTLDNLLPLLTQRFGPIDFTSNPFDFSAYSEYYAPEMGAGLVRYFIGFSTLIDRTRLPDIKRETIALERDLSVSGRRTVNLDPGYMALGQLFLASTKDNFCRIYLRDGIFAEVTLVYKSGEWQPFPWTYRDYADAPYRNTLRSMRETYRKQLAES